MMVQRRLWITGMLLLGACKNGDGANKTAPPTVTEHSEGTDLKDMSVAMLSEQLRSANPPHVYDCNSPDAFQKRHIPKAKWVEFASLKAQDLPSSKDEKLVFYCWNEH